MSMKLMKQNKGWRPRSPVYFMNFWADSLPTSLLYISILLFRPWDQRRRISKGSNSHARKQVNRLLRGERVVPK
jgi:hypothetical protein